MPEITSKSWLMVGVLSIVWGSTFMFIEIALTGIPPFWLATLRLFVATLALGVVWGAQGFRLSLDSENRPGALALIWTGAISTGVPFLMLNWGQQYVTSGFAGTAMSVVPLVVLPLAHFLVPGERMTPRTTLGVTLGFVGVWLLVGQDAFESSGAQLELWGRLACIGVAVCYAVNSITVRRLPPVDPVGLTTVMMAIGALVSLPFAIAFEGMPPVPGWPALVALLVLGLFSTAAMNLLRVLVIRSAGPVFMNLVNYVIPVWSVLIGWALLSEALPPALLGALVLILAGVGLSQWPALKALFRG